MIDDNFIESLPDDPLEAAHNICKEFFLFNEKASGTWPDHYDEYIEFYALFVAFFQSHHMKYTVPELSDNRSDNVDILIQFVLAIRGDLDKQLTSNSIERKISQFQAKFKNTFSYEFSEGDLDRIQQLINELREYLTNSELFEEAHKQRLLKRLERLQVELHKNVSDLDRFWGLIGDAGVVLGKLGKDAKPLVDRIREIAGIVWSTQARAEELPSGTPLPRLQNESVDSE